MAKDIEALYDEMCKAYNEVYELNKLLQKRLEKQQILVDAFLEGRNSERLKDLVSHIVEEWLEECPNRGKCPKRKYEAKEN